MNRRYLLVAIAGILAISTIVGCRNSQTLVNDPTVPLAYLKDSSPDNINNLSKAYGTAINKNRKQKIKQSGLFSDYAVTLALLGNREEANKWFNNEMATFPNSRAYVNQLKKALIPEYLNDTTRTTEPIQESDSTTANNKMLNKAVKTVIDEAAGTVTDTVEEEQPQPANDADSAAGTEAVAEPSSEPTIETPATEVPVSEPQVQGNPAPKGTATPTATPTASSAPTEAPKASPSTIDSTTTHSKSSASKSHGKHFPKHRK